MDNHGFRYYDPEIGRYISRDPIGYGDGMNVYLSCHNNPINFVDPLGLNDEYGDDDESPDGDESSWWDSAVDGVSDAVTTAGYFAGSIFYDPRQYLKDAAIASDSAAEGAVDIFVDMAKFATKGAEYAYNTGGALAYTVLDEFGYDDTAEQRYGHLARARHKQREALGEFIDDPWTPMVESLQQGSERFWTAVDEGDYETSGHVFGKATMGSYYSGLENLDRGIRWICR